MWVFFWSFTFARFIIFTCCGKTKSQQSGLTQTEKWRQSNWSTVVMMWCVFAAFKTSFFFQPQTINHTPDMWLFSHQGFPLQLEPLKNRLFCRYLLSKCHLTWYHFVFSSHIWTEVWNDRLTVAINLIPGLFKVMCENEIYFFQNLLLSRILWDLLTIKIKYKMSFYSVNHRDMYEYNPPVQTFFPTLTWNTNVFHRWHKKYFQSFHVQQCLTN